MSNTEKNSWLWTPKQIFFFILGGIMMLAVSYPFVWSWFGMTDVPASENLTPAQWLFFGVGFLLVYQGLPLKNLAGGISNIAKKFTGGKTNENNG